jgi:hypothetical protein
MKPTNSECYVLVTLNSQWEGGGGASDDACVGRTARLAGITTQVTSSRNGSRLETYETRGQDTISVS